MPSVLTVTALFITERNLGVSFSDTADRTVAFPVITKVRQIQSKSK